MKLIVGLGNPDEQYKNNRHNVGFMVAERLVNSRAWKESQKGKCWYFWLDDVNEEIEVVRPQTFMNQSGESVIYIKKKHPGLKEEDILVVHDDLDIPLGSYKLQFGKGPRQHNGVLSIEKELGTKDFWRLRIGIENRHPGSNVNGEEYVLQDFTANEREFSDKLIREKIIPEIKNWLLKK